MSKVRLRFALAVISAARAAENGANRDSSEAARSGVGHETPESLQTNQICALELVDRRNRLRRRWSISQSTVGPDCIVLLPPALYQDLGLLQGVENLAVEQLVPELPIKALVVTVLPGLPGSM